MQFRGPDGRHEEWSETVVPLSSAGDGTAPRRYLNVWTTPGNRYRSEPAEMLLALTPREREVARLYAAGLNATEVGEALGISVHTARDHRDNIYEKLGIHSRAELGRLLPPR